MLRCSLNVYFTLITLNASLSYFRDDFIPVNLCILVHYDFKEILYNTDMPNTDN